MNEHPAQPGADPPAARRVPVATLAVTKDNWLVMHNLGTVREQRGDHAEAVALLREALRLDPGNAEAWNNLAVARFGQGQVAEAVSGLREAIRLRPGFARVQAALERE